MAQNRLPAGNFVIQQPYSMDLVSRDQYGLNTEHEHSNKHFKLIV